MATAEQSGLKFERVFSDPDVHPFDLVEWQQRTAEILGPKGVPVFRQENVEVPAGWSDQAVGIVFDKYAYGRLGTSERETSVRQIIDRVVSSIGEFGWLKGYFSNDHAMIFREELTWLLVNQYGAFNSPVWFNVGCRPGTGYAWDFEKGDVVDCDDLYEAGYLRYQGSACFIVGVEDSVDSIARNAATEMAIFKDGSGAGSDRSPLRSSREPISGGGTASGPISFMQVYDAVGRVTKSGGRTRRAAKMEILRCDHPDIMEFIWCKGAEERKAKALIAAGYEANFNGEAYNSVLFQNSNLSVRATDAFLEAVEAGAGSSRWQTLSVVTGKPRAADGTVMPAYWACDVMDAIAEEAWQCGDPGMQYDGTIQRWHTIPNAGYLYASNPCSEYMSIDDSACNLASLNLMKFRREDGSFDVARFRAACRVFTVAQDILVDLGSYPTPEIARNAHRFRQLGLGYTNLGSLIMAAGLPYDSDEARSLAGAITAIMTGQGYLTSAEMAGTEGLGAFDGYAADRENVLRVMKQHQEAAWKIEAGTVDEGMRSQVYALWREVVDQGKQHGYRNSQATVLAPTGTISFMMDAQTTGIEPAIALVSYKNLWGRGRLKMVNGTVEEALRTLGYTNVVIGRIIDHIDKFDMIENYQETDGPRGCPTPLKLDHISVFDCAFPPANGTRSIPWQGHVKMMAAVQPFISGAISKTVNMPRNATVADIRAAYMLGWKLGLKALAIYRDGSKDSQPVSTSKGDVNAFESLGRDYGNDHANGSDRRDHPGDQVGGMAVGASIPRRDRLPDTRSSITHKFTVGNVEAYLNVGHYPDGRPGELFIWIAKAGTTVNGLVGEWARMVSVSLQYGIPLDVITGKFIGARYEPSGLTRNPAIPIATSVTDYVARWLGLQYGEHDNGRDLSPQSSVDDHGGGVLGDRSTDGHRVAPAVPVPAGHHDGQTCGECGGLMVRAGSCYACPSCGSTSGCG